jgi:hypothetical protein
MENETEFPHGLSTLQRIFRIVFAPSAMLAAPAKRKDIAIHWRSTNVVRLWIFGLRSWEARWRTTLPGLC